MRIPNLSVSDSVTRTIRDLELKRFELDQQISTGQKIKYPEDDGLRVGKLINLESEKAKLSQTTKIHNMQNHSIRPSDDGYIATIL